MDQKLDKQICERFPKICADRYKSPRESCFAFGFEFEKGWADLVVNLFDFIQRHIDHAEKYGEPIPQFIIKQQKEKFGILRTYYSGGDEVIRGAVDFAEFLSAGICEYCGSTKDVGRNKKGWIKTTCKTCYLEKSNDTSLDNFVLNGSSSLNDDKE